MFWGETFVEIAAKSIEKGIQGELGAALWIPPSRGLFKFSATAEDFSMFLSPCFYNLQLDIKTGIQYKLRVLLRITCPPLCLLTSHYIKEFAQHKKNINKIYTPEAH
jgi:hypothetical protein